MQDQSNHRSGRAKEGKENTTMKLGGGREQIIRGRGSCIATKKGQRLERRRFRMLSCQWPRASGTHRYT